MLLDGPWIRTARATGLLHDGTAQPTIFTQMSALAARTGALNLGQGFPDTQPPQAVADAAVDAIRAGVNQYAPGPGHPVLREAIAAHQERFYGMSVDPEREVLVTTGATEALTATILALVSPGEEVVTLEPHFDSYAAAIGLAGAVHRPVPLVSEPDPDGTPGDFRLRLDADALRTAITPRTRMVLLNTPHNPTGIVLGREDLQLIVDLTAQADAVLVTDEVYEHLVYDGEHVPAGTLPGAEGRTVTISSAGKTLSVTGWKVGWAIAAPELIEAIASVKQWLTFTSGAPLQYGVARGLALPDATFDAIRADLHERRDLLVEGLREAGIPVSVPQAGYFVVADAARVGSADADALCRRLPEEAGVVGIPVSALFQDPASAGAARGWIRFAFCKDRPTIREACARLERWAAARRG